MSFLYNTQFILSNKKKITKLDPFIQKMYKYKNFLTGLLYLKMYKEYFFAVLFFFLQLSKKSNLTSIFIIKSKYLLTKNLPQNSTILFNNLTLTKWRQGQLHNMPLSVKKRFKSFEGFYEYFFIFQKPLIIFNFNNNKVLNNFINDLLRKPSLNTPTDLPLLLVDIRKNNLNSLNSDNLFHLEIPLNTNTSYTWAYQFFKHFFCLITFKSINFFTKQYLLYLYFTKQFKFFNNNSFYSSKNLTNKKIFIKYLYYYFLLFFFNKNIKTQYYQKFFYLLYLSTISLYIVKLKKLILFKYLQYVFKIYKKKTKFKISI